MTTFDRIIGDLGRMTGIKELAFDGEGLCRLGFDAAAVDLQRSKDGRRLLVSSLVGELPTVETEGTMRRLLEANAFFARTRGATVGLVGAGVVLAREVGDGIEAEGLAQLLEAFLVAIADVRRLLDEAVAVDATVDPLSMMRV